MMATYYLRKKKFRIQRQNFMVENIIKDPKINFVRSCAINNAF